MSGHGAMDGEERSSGSVPEALQASPAQPPISRMELGCRLGDFLQATPPPAAAAAAISLLCLLTSDPDGEVRLAVAKALVPVAGDGQADAALRQLANDGDVRVRQAAIQGLSKRRHTSEIAPPTAPAVPEPWKRFHRFVEEFHQMAASPGSSPITDQIERLIDAATEEFRGMLIALVHAVQGSAGSALCVPGECPLREVVAPAQAPTSDANPSSAPFTGGKLVFHERYVELVGHRILGNTGAGITRQILELLARTKPDGEYTAMSGAQLARRIGGTAGQNTIAGCLRNLRQRIARTLQASGVRCERDSVIMSGGPGYRLNPWIVVERADDRPLLPK